MGKCATHHGVRFLSRSTSSSSLSSSFLYALFLAADANFRLRRSLVSSHSVDPGLSHGFSYFVAELPYKAFLAPRTSLPQEVCVISIGFNTH
jgi:hypothetical protein